MPSCSVPPSRTSVLTFSAIACSVARNRQVRRTEQRRARIVEQEIERVGRDQRVAVHEGQLAMHLADQCERSAAGAHRCDLRQQIGGEVGVRAETQQAGGRFAGRRRGDELRDARSGRGADASRATCV